jgi:hypothetical protein
VASLADLTLAAQQRCDRVNSPKPTPAEWTNLINRSAQRLYGLLTSSYQDYNIARYGFTLAGGTGYNLLPVGPGTGVPDFMFPRGLWYQVNGSPTQRWRTLPRLNAFVERNMHIGPVISLLYGAVPDCWDLMGSQIEVLPDASAGGTYLLTYVPRMPLMVQPGDTIDQFWLTVNGWEEYIILDAARKAAMEEESLELVAALTSQLAELRESILREAMPRDDSGPGHIADTRRVRNNFGYEGGGGRGGWGY